MPRKRKNKKKSKLNSKNLEEEEVEEIKELVSGGVIFYKEIPSQFPIKIEFDKQKGPCGYGENVWFEQKVKFDGHNDWKKSQKRQERLCSIVQIEKLRDKLRTLFEFVQDQMKQDKMCVVLIDFQNFYYGFGVVERLNPTEQVMLQEDPALLRQEALQKILDLQNSFEGKDVLYFVISAEQANEDQVEVKMDKNVIYIPTVCRAFLTEESFKITLDNTKNFVKFAGEFGVQEIKEKKAEIEEYKQRIDNLELTIEQLKKHNIQDISTNIIAAQKFLRIFRKTVDVNNYNEAMFRRYVLNPEKNRVEVIFSRYASSNLYFFNNNDHKVYMCVRDITVPLEDLFEMDRQEVYRTFHGNFNYTTKLLYHDKDKVYLGSDLERSPLRYVFFLYQSKADLALVYHHIDLRNHVEHRLGINVFMFNSKGDLITDEIYYNLDNFEEVYLQTSQSFTPFSPEQVARKKRRAYQEYNKVRLRDFIIRFPTGLSIKQERQNFMLRNRKRKESDLFLEEKLWFYCLKCKMEARIQCSNCGNQLINSLYRKSECIITFDSDNYNDLVKELQNRFEYKKGNICIMQTGEIIDEKWFDDFNNGHQVHPSLPKHNKIQLDFPNRVLSVQEEKKPQVSLRNALILQNNLFFKQFEIEIRNELSVLETKLKEVQSVLTNLNQDPKKRKSLKFQVCKLGPGEYTAIPIHFIKENRDNCHVCLQNKILNRFKSKIDLINHVWKNHVVKSEIEIKDATKKFTNLKNQIATSFEQGSQLVNSNFAVINPYFNPAILESEIKKYRREKHHRSWVPCAGSINQGRQLVGETDDYLLVEMYNHLTKNGNAQLTKNCFILSADQYGWSHKVAPNQAKNVISHPYFFNKPKRVKLDQRQSLVPMRNNEKIKPAVVFA